MKYTFPALLAATVLIVNCGRDTPGVTLRIRNETRFIITDVSLAASTDTLMGDTIRSSCVFEGNMVLVPSEQVRMSWMENGEDREFEIALLDSSHRAEIVLISILPGSRRYEVFYRF